MLERALLHVVLVVSIVGGAHVARDEVVGSEICIGPAHSPVTADWCFTCKANERLVLETEQIAAAFEEHGVVPMRADWTNRNKEIATLLAEHGRYSIPFYLLYRPGEQPFLFPELLTKRVVLDAVSGGRGSHDS